MFDGDESTIEVNGSVLALAEIFCQLREVALVTTNALWHQPGRR
jgi:hypothetical protein